MTRTIPPPASREARRSYCTCPDSLKDQSVSSFEGKWSLWVTDLERGGDGRPCAMSFTRYPLNLCGCPLHGDGNELPEGI